MKVLIGGVEYVPSVAPVKSAGIRASLRVTEHLLRALWLYPHYNVASRGPYGLIVEAIDEVAPGAAEMLRDGREPHDVMRAIGLDEDDAALRKGDPGE